MKAKRRRHSSEFKAKVGMEALKGVKTIQQLAKKFEVHPVQVSVPITNCDSPVSTVLITPAGPWRVIDQVCILCV